ncbi:MAG: anthranilate phosphoribosyltransferase [Syntrophus sp. (in: bacteria)]|nr:anthranilate phosphoribosyltransferase [Syntrophus sp. (in: bacteria)]
MGPAKGFASSKIIWRFVMERLEKLRKGMDLTFDEAGGVFSEILDGRKEAPYIEEMLILLAEKGEGEEEIAACAGALLSRAVRLDHDCHNLLDIVGTGGDGSGSFNISTAAAIVSSIFLPVAKHGNRAVSSKSGSADFLEALNVPINLEKEEAARHLREKNFVFLFAQKFHPVMKLVAPIRQRIKRRTIFNLLGPLCNPARPDNLLIGVFRKEFIPTYLGAVTFLNIPNVLIVASHDGLDEISISDYTLCCLKKGSSVKTFEFDPKSFGIYAPIDAVKGYEPTTNARIAREVFQGDHRDLCNAIAINAAFALQLAGVEDDLKKAFILAREAITSGKACEKLMELTA